MKNQKPLQFILVLIGLCFFFNPYFAAIDILPDFIGALLVALGLLRVSRISEPMREAGRAFFRLALIDIVKNILLLFVFGGSAMGEQELLVLIVAFLGATLGTLFTVLAMRTLLDGFDWLATANNCEALYCATRGKRSRTERFAHFTAVFIVVKEVLLLLPEFAALLNSTYVDSHLIRIYDYIGVMRLLVILPATVLGIWWLVALIRYFVCLHREREFLRALGSCHADYVKTHPGVFIKARYTVAFLFISAGLILLTDFYLDFQNIIPDPIGGILLLIGICLFGPRLRLSIPTLIAGLAYTVIAAVSSRLSYLFSSEHVAVDIGRSEAVAAEYLKMWLFSLAEFLIFLIFLALLLLSVRAVLLKWGGYMPTNTDEAFEKRHAKRMHEAFDGQLIKCYVFGFISGLLSFLYDYLKTWPNLKIFRLMEGFWILDFSFALLFAIYAAYTFSLVVQQIGERFQFE